VCCIQKKMFEGFSGVWTPILFARELGRKPAAARLAGEDVVLYRDGRGGVGAMIDRCPHRGVKLSLGQVTPEGRLECAFHGWCFDRQGECVHVPLNPPAGRRASAIALPVREAGGLLWVFTGSVATGEPEVPDALVGPDWARWFHHEDWACHWTRAMENMLDMPHVPFVHRRTIGRRQRAAMRPDSVMRIRLEETTAGFHIRSELDGATQGGALDWRRPNGMVLMLMAGTPPERGFRQHVFCIPIDANTTRMMVISTRTFLRYNPIGWLSDQFNRLILLEDRAIVESSQPLVVPPPAEETSSATDAPTLHFRRWYLRTLASVEPAPPGPAGRLRGAPAPAELPDVPAETLPHA
jgi:phenylpropionate dioxygenase-like ring-hydroxylating dioxygenase large terminal subunit